MSPGPSLIPGGQLVVDIEAVGGRGDGIARIGGTTLFVPYALEGERVRVSLVRRERDGFRARLVALERSVARAEPPCRHFGICGGCALQHMAEQTYRAWKVDRVRSALARRGFRDIQPAPLETSPPGSRRRARLAFHRTGGTMRLGFRARASHRIVDLAMCPVLRPALTGLVAPLRQVLAGLELSRSGGEAVLTETDTGLDLLLVTERPPGLADREALAAFAEAADLARLSWARPGGTPEPIAARREVVMRIGGITLQPPPGAFLQATAEGEAVLRREVEQALHGSARIADLYAGLGTLGLGLAAAGARLAAFDSDPALLEALTDGARRAGLDRVTVEPRDLERRPLTPAELQGLGGVVLDPPRAGARAQAEQLASSPVPVVVMASCHPPSFARDARILEDGGLGLERLVPVDQFLWSAEVELVAVFRRAGSRKRARAP